MNYKRSVWVIALMLFAASLVAQVEEPVPTEKKEKGRKEKLAPSERIVFGGDLGLSFGSITYIKLAPVVGYRVLPRLTLGLGPIYIYEKYKNLGFETSTYGGKGVASFTVLRGSDLGERFALGDILLHLENEVVSVENYNDTRYTYQKRLWIDNFLVGGGISQAVGNRLAISVFVLWDITQNKNSPYYYTSPIIKFGFSL
jgi:hypothetical protein